MTGITFKALVGQIIGLINIIVPVLAAAALVVFFIGIVRFVYRNANERGHIADKELIVWGLLAIFVLFSLWGLVSLLKRSFLG